MRIHFYGIFCYYSEQDINYKTTIHMSEKASTNIVIEYNKIENYFFIFWFDT